MTDRELLELAAKAAGYVVESMRSDGGAWCHPVGEQPDEDGDHPGLFGWNPLIDDGDALRLAVKLDLCLVPYPIYARPKHSICCTRRRAHKDDVDVPDVVELYEGDPYAATRRAIVRAAAAIAQDGGERT